MSWEQHRYAVERAARARRDAADWINEESQMVTLQGEAHGSEAELLTEVAEFLQSLEGSKPGAWMEDAGKAFTADLNKALGTLSNFCATWNLPAPDLLCHPKWQSQMSDTSAMPLGSPLIYYGIRIRFGAFASADLGRWRRS